MIDNRKILMFEAKIVDADGGCRVWTGTCDRDGYGKWKPDGAYGRVLRAHRLAWELAHGPVPNGMSVCHTCDVPACCNVDHLFLGTNAENTADKVAKGRQAGGAEHSEIMCSVAVRGSRWREVHMASHPRGERVGTAKLTAAQVAEIRAAAMAGEPQSALATRFSISKSQVWRIVARQTWAHVNDLVPGVTEP